MSIQTEIDRIVGEVSTQEELMEEILTTLAEKSANTGGSAKPEQEKTIDITENGTTEVLPDSGKVLSKVTVNVAVEASSNGESINPLEYATFNSGRVFFGSKFPDNTEIKMKINHATPNITNQFNYTNAKSFTIDFSNVTSINFANGLTGSSKCTHVALIGDGHTVSDYRSAFEDCVVLEDINGELDLTNAYSVDNMFRKCYLLENVRFVKNTIFKSISFGECFSLSDESLQSIVDGLATVETAQTITFFSGDTSDKPSVKAKLTETQIATITGKNWTLA